MSGTVAAAHGAISDALGHVARGGSPADEYVTGRMGQFKPAIDAVGKVAARSGKSGATLRLTASGDDGGFTAGVSLVIVSDLLACGELLPGRCQNCRVLGSPRHQLLYGRRSS